MVVKLKLPLLLSLIVLMGYFPRVSGWELSNEEYYEYIEEMNITAEKVIQSSSGYFECNGIGIIDTGAALDMPIYVFEVESKKLLCMHSMGQCISSDPKNRKDCRNECPPPEFKNGCSK